MRILWFSMPFYKIKALIFKETWNILFNFQIQLLGPSQSVVHCLCGKAEPHCFFLLYPPAPTYSLKTYKGVERNANLEEGGTFQRNSTLPQLHLEMPFWSNNKKEILKLWAGNKLLSTYCPAEEISFLLSLSLCHSFESLLGWKSRLEVASPYPSQVSPGPQFYFH